MPYVISIQKNTENKQGKKDSNRKILYVNQVLNFDQSINSTEKSDDKNDVPSGVSSNLLNQIKLQFDQEMCQNSFLEDYSSSKSDEKVYK